MITEASKSKVCSAGRRDSSSLKACSTETQQSQQVQMRTEGRWLETHLLLREAGLFVLFRPSADWLRPTHTMEGSLLEVHQWRC